MSPHSDSASSSRPDFPADLSDREYLQASLDAYDSDPTDLKGCHEDKCKRATVRDGYRPRKADLDHISACSPRSEEHPASEQKLDQPTFSFGTGCMITEVYLGVDWAAAVALWSLENLRTRPCRKAATNRS